MIFERVLESRSFEDKEINELEIDELKNENIKIKTENTKLKHDKEEVETENIKLKQDLDEFKKELESKKNRKFQEKCILIAQVLLGEKPIIEYRPPFLNGLELDAFFQKYPIALEVQGAQHRLHSTSWYKDVKKLEDVVNRDRKKRCICQDNGIFLLEIIGNAPVGDIYYINRLPGATKAQAHQTLGIELNIILKALPPKSREYYRADDLKRSHLCQEQNDTCSLQFIERSYRRNGLTAKMRLLPSTDYSSTIIYNRVLQFRLSDPNSKKDNVNIELWQEHYLRLGKLAVENRINKCEILTTGIRAVTGAVVTEFPKETSLKRKAYEPEESDEPEEANKLENSDELEESYEPKQNKKKKSTMDDELPDDVKKWSPNHVKKFLESRMKNLDFNEADIEKIRNQDLTGRAFLRLTEEKLTRKPGLYELKP
ncbi:6567_t:CDS:2, partial [Ambispora gerdemannii]